MTSAYTINLNPNITTPVKTGYTFKAGDKGITFNIVVNEMDNATGMTAKICFMRANGASVEATLTGTGPTFSYTTLGNEFAVPGVVVADVKFYNSTTQRYSTASFVFNVIGDTLDGIGAGTGGYSDQLEQLTEELQDLSEDFEDTLQEYIDAFGTVGPVNPMGNYNSTTQYHIFDLVYYNGSSYLCRRDCKNQTPSANSQYWQLYALAGDNDAAHILYDNSSSGISASNVQDALDEICGRSFAPRNISSQLSNLLTAIAEQNIEKYGYKIGDYFVGTSQTSNNYVYWLADKDTFYGGFSNYAIVDTHHLGIVVDTKTDSKWYNSSSISGVNYKNSTLHTYLKGDVLNIIKADMRALFGGSTGLEHLIPNTKEYARLGGWEWSGDNDNTEYISALTEMQVCGASLWSGDKYQQGEGDKQLELFFKFKYCRVFGLVSAWLRSISTSSNACRIGITGRIDDHPVSNSLRAAGLILLG